MVFFDVDGRFLRDQPFHRNLKLERLFSTKLLDSRTCTGFSYFQERKFHVHIHALPMLIFSSSVIFRRNSLAFAWCYQKMHYFCLAAKNDFLSLHLHFWLLFSDFPWTFPTFLQTTLLLFLIDFWFAEPFRRIICLNGDEFSTQVAKFRVSNDDRYDWARDIGPTSSRSLA